MENTCRLSADLRWNARTVSAFIVLALLPNLLGMINIQTPLGFKLHLFQIAVFLAAALFGPSGGVVSGLAGSVYSAMIMGNPCLMIGNATLGCFTGLFLRRGMGMLPSVWLAFLIQLPWLVLTDYYVIGLSGSFIAGLVFALFLSNTLWAMAVSRIEEPVRRFLAC